MESARQAAARFGVGISSAIEHVFARQKVRMKLFIRTFGIARATTKIGMTNLAYNLMRFVWHERSASA